MNVTTTGSRDETSQGLTLVLHRLDVVQSRLSPRAGHDIGNALILIDALGECATLPMQFCFSQDEMHMKQHDYMISTEDGKSLGESNNWSDVVR